MKKSYTNMAIASAVAFAFGASSVGYSQTAVDQQITAPTSFAGNSTDLFAASVGNTGSAVLNPTTAQAAVITTTYNAAVTQLNAGSGTTGSAAAFQLAANNLQTALATGTPAQQAAAVAAQAVAQKAYNANIQTVNNLAVAATVVTGSNDTFSTFTGNPGDALTTATNAASGGVSAGAVATANAASASIGAVTTYYADGGATTGSTANGGTSDLEQGVIAPIQALGTIAPAADNGTGVGAVANNGFVDADEVAVAAANTALNNAAANYTAVINNPASTIAQVDAAALALSNAQTTYVNATNTLYTNFVPITQANKTALLGTVLNGSWERQALLNNANVTSTNTAAIASNNTNIVSNGVTASNNTLAIASNNTNIVSNGVVGSNNTVAIASNNTNIVSNGVVGSNNTVAIASNNTNIVSNGVVGSTNTVAIASNNTNIVSNGVVGSTNTVAIASNNTNIGLNTNAIASNNTNIVSNGVVGSTNTVAIASNNTNIGLNTNAIASNNTNIVSNGVVGSTNTVAIASNNTNIGLNTNAIASNNTNIGLNTNAIASNNTTIQQEITDRSGLISDKGPNAEGNQIVHIGDNSLITEELGGTQRLRAENGSGDEIAIRFDGSQGVYVDNFINVTAPDAPASFTTNSSGAGSQLPSTEPGTATTTPVVTVLGTTTGEQIDGASGGVLIENNGNVTLSQAGGQESTVEFLQAVSFDVANPGEPNEGLPVAGTERYVAGYENTAGDFVALSPEFTTQAGLDNWIATTDINDSAYNPVREVQTLAGSGGNLTVGGNAYIAGLQSSYNPDGDVVAEFGAVNNAIGQNSSAIAQNARGIKNNRDDIERNSRGIAMVAALQHTTVLPGMSNALDVGAAHFEGETGMSINYARRINENWQINFGAASTTDFDESVIKAGVGVQW